MAKERTFRDQANNEKSVVCSDRAALELIRSGWTEVQPEPEEQAEEDQQRGVSGGDLLGIIGL